MLDARQEFFIRRLFAELRKRRLLLGLADYEALRQALRLGFGLASRQILCELCIALWASSLEEQEIITVLFNQLAPDDWAGVAAETPAMDDEPPAPAESAPPPAAPLPAEPLPPPEHEPITKRADSIPDIPDALAADHERRFLFVPQFPLSQREVAQIWRRLRRPLRVGPPEELDVAATIARRTKVGTVTAPVLLPRRRNMSRLLLLVDRQGSMTPYQWYVERVCEAMVTAARLGRVATYYFHDTPTRGADRALLKRAQGRVFPRLDPILGEIPPLERGALFGDPALHEALPTAQILAEHAHRADVVIISDAGAARGRFDALRLLDTVAFLKALRRHEARFAWLNPVPAASRLSGTATEIARHVPMFPLDRPGMERAVDTLRGRPYPLERPV